MKRAAIGAVLVAAAMICSSTVARAQCTKDTDCKGDRVCEAGQCTAAPEPPSVAPPPSTTSATVPATPPASAQKIPSLPNVATVEPSRLVPPAATVDLGADEPRLRRRSTGLMAGGIVMVSVGPLLLALAALTNGPTDCDPDGDQRASAADIDRCTDKTRVYALAISGGLLIAGGIPMIIVGAKKVPVARGAPVTFGPWASTRAAGLQLGLQL